MVRQLADRVAAQAELLERQAEKLPADLAGLAKIWPNLPAWTPAYPAARK